MSDLTLNVKSREGIGTQAVKKLRAQNQIPGIFYFHGSENIPFIVDRAQLHSIWGHESGLLELVFDGKDSKMGVIRDIQFDPVKGKPIHLDVMGIKMGEKLKVTVSITMVGTPEGVKNHGGVLQQTLRELDIECLPSKIPEQIELDVSALEINESLNVSDLQVEDVTILTDESTVVAIVSPPRVMTEGGEREEGEEAAEPQVLSQKSKDND